jgi:hypothetical protein
MNQNAGPSAELSGAGTFWWLGACSSVVVGINLRQGEKGTRTAQHHPRVRADVQSSAARHHPSSTRAAALAPPGRHPCYSSCSALAHSPPGLRPSSFVPCFTLLLCIRKAELVVVRWAAHSKAQCREEVPTMAKAEAFRSAGWASRFTGWALHQPLCHGPRRAPGSPSTQDLSRSLCLVLISEDDRFWLFFNRNTRTWLIP